MATKAKKTVSMVRGTKIEFIEFSCKRGQRLLDSYVRSLDSNSDEFKEVARIF